MNTPDQTPTQAASAALTHAIADDLYAASTTGNVIDMLVKGDYETWREHAERIGGIAAESTPAAVRALLAGDWLERVLSLHADFMYVNDGIDGGHFVCECGHAFGYEDGAHAEWEAHLAAAIRAAATDGAA